MLKALLDGPLRVSFEEGVGAIVEGSTLIGRLLGTSQQPPNLASPTGFEPWGTGAITRDVARFRTMRAGGAREIARLRA